MEIIITSSQDDESSHEMRYVNAARVVTLVYHLLCL